MAEERLELKAQPMTRRTRSAAPPATGLEGNHHQTAFVGQELAVLRLFVLPSAHGQTCQQVCHLYLPLVARGLPKTPSKALHMPSSWPFACSADCLGGALCDNTGPCTLKNMPNTLGVGHTASSSFSNREPVACDTNSSEPQGCQEY